MAARRQETRSRWGCMNCRERRKKCDEAQPNCHLCEERGVECVYPDWNIVKCSHTRQRRRLLHDTAIRPASARLPLLPAHPSNIETRFIYHFNNVLANLISFSFPQTGVSNPFLLHVLPRTSSSAQVQRAVEAVAAAHLFHLGAESRELATQLHSKALNLLAVELSLPQLDEVSRMNGLVCSLLLIYYEIVLGDSASNAWCHLQGAKALLESHHNAPETPCLLFLRKVFQYFNVMVALSLGQQPLFISGDRSPDFTEKMDPIFGCTGRLWPLMHHLSDLMARARLGENITEEAERLMSSLQAWSIEPSLGADAYTEAMIQIALSYKFCGLLMLCMTVPSGQPKENGGILGTCEPEIYRSAFDCVLRVCVLSMPMATLTWPLYVVGRFATMTGDRTIILHIFSRFLEKHHMKVVDGARTAVKAHWGERRPDWYHADSVLFG